MHLRLLLTLFLILSALSSWGQKNLGDSVLQARKALAEVELLNSKEHPNYAEKAMDLALLYYQQGLSDEPDSLVAQSLRVFGREYGAESDKFQSQLTKLEEATACYLYSDYLIETAKYAAGENSLAHLKACREQVKCHLKEEDYDAHDQSVLIAQQLEEKYPQEDLASFMAFLPPTLRKLVLLQRAFERQRGENFTDISDLIETEAKNKAERLLLQEISFLLYKALQEDEYAGVLNGSKYQCYMQVRAQLIALEEEGKGEEALSIKKKLPAEMQRFFAQEMEVRAMIAKNETNSERFYKKFKTFIEDSDQGYAYEFTDVDVMEEVDLVLKNLRKYHGGRKAPFYYQIKYIKDSQRYTDEELERRSLAEELKVIQEENNGDVSEEELDVRLKMALLAVKDQDDEVAFKAFQDLMFAATNKDLAETDFDRIFEDDYVPDNKPSYEEIYLAKIPAPWRAIVEEETKLLIADYDGDDRIPFYQLAAGGQMIKAGILVYDNGFQYVKEAIETIPLAEEEAFVQQLIPILEERPLMFYDEVYKSATTHLSLASNRKIIAAVLEFIRKKEGSIYDDDYADVLGMKARYLYAQENSKENGLAQEALATYEQALTIYEKTEGISIFYVELLEKITDKLLKDDRWDMASSQQLFERRLKGFELQDLEVYMGRYLSAHQDFANWHYNNDRFVKAEGLYKKLLLRLVDADQFDRQLVDEAEVYYRLGRIYRKTGRYVAAYEALQTARQKVAEPNGLLVQILDDFGQNLQALAQYQEAKDYFDQALVLLLELESQGRINRKEKFKDALNYIKILRHQANAMLEEGEYEQAYDIFKRIMTYEDNSKLLDFKYDASLQQALAYYYDLMYEDEKAKKYQEMALKGLKDPTELADLHLQIASFYQKRNQLPLAEKHYRQALNIDLKRLEDSYNDLPEEERLEFLRPLAKRLNAFFLFVAENPQPDLVQTALNAHFRVKGLALETSSNIRQVIYASDNVVLQNNFEEMQNLKKELARLLSLSPKERKAEGVQLTTLEKEIKDLEERISRDSKALRTVFEQQNQQLNLAQLKQRLGPNEVAIDFLRLERSDEYGNISAQYYGMLMRPEWESPKMIPLCLESELAMSLQNEVSPAGLNYITDDLESNNLYFMLWEPMEKELEGAKTIHLCPTGLLAKIAFATLRVDDFSRLRLMDRHDIVYHSAMRDLLRKQTASQKAKISLIGGVKFDLSQAELEIVAEAQDVELPFEKIRMGRLDIPDFGAFNEEALAANLPEPKAGASRGEDFLYLKGTEREVNEIAQQFQQESWQVNKIMGLNALEETVVEHINKEEPQILHLATHGYFFPAKKLETDLRKALAQKQKEKTFEERLAEIENPLFRSGLALTNINYVWKGRAPIEGLADGIFSAYEVSNLNLFQTELVVLSACETGRGDIDNNEGIMGLQRAFKMAGAQRLVISLWKVPDAQTSELMQRFYRHYLSLGDYHKAFRLAQDEMRKQYRNPYYWAAFILLE
ncbi:CHAT domain-containing protein [Saprospira sp. CCB-QB6]|uniref:CHAT domain-containing protein n=1 Tax=Saprospira sp. CCB-QB6 TaxID=3023936 RepID=UPI0023491287|nr:CHAT domain-containing tetratricopeptide repeat protein [Saprospira sp. CCB-QB6]WCL80179.1 CHAT domain-containing protein [Saprospira sp. CCB-QB6]